MPEQKTINRLYDEWHQNLHGAEEEDHDDAPWHRLAKPHLTDVRGATVLEIACGRGGFSRYLAARGANLVAADFSVTAIGIASTLLHEMHDEGSRVAIAADVEALPFKNDSFDIVVSLETLEHVPHPDKGLAELVRVVRPGGKLVITTPNYFGLFGIYRVYRRLVGRPYTELGQPINNVTTLVGRIRGLRRLGCTITAVDGFGEYLYLPGRNPIPMPWLNRPRFLMKWVGAHSLTVATKPRRRTTR